MLDADTKKKIDSLRNILVGKIPNPQSQVEQITTGLIYKFMYDMDQESIEMGGEGSFFVGDYEKYSWDNLFDTKLSGVDKVSLYSSAIEGMYLNPNAPELFRNIFKNAFLPFKDPSTLNMFLKEINEFHYSHSEKLGDAFEYLISIMGSQGDAGQFRTPRHIIDFIVEIINPQKHETVLDPACGTAGFLISSYKHILKTNTDKKLGDLLSASDRKKVGENIGGYDISPEMIKLSLVNMYLHGFSTPDIEEYDTLSSEDKWNEYYDVILANPPFFSPKGGIQPHKRFGVQSTKAEVLFTSYILEHLKPDGRAGIIVPEGIIFQNGKAYKQLRKQLLEHGLVGVISLPVGVFQPYSGVKTSILLIDKKLGKNKNDIFFVNVKNEGFSLNSHRTPIKENDLPTILEEFNHWRLDSNPLTNLSLQLSKDLILSNSDFSLSTNKYLEDQNFSSKFPIIKLGDVCDFKGGTQPPKSTFIEEEKEEYIRLIQTRDYKSDKFKVYIPTSERHKTCNATDIMIGRYGPPVFQILRGLTGAYNVALMKCIPDKQSLSDDWLYHLLKSDLVQERIIGLSQRVRQSGVRPDDLKSQKVPLPPLEVQQEIVDELEGYQKIIDGCKQVVENYKPTIDIDPSWEMVELGELCSLMTGGTPTSTNKEFYDGGDIPWLVSGDIHKGEIFDCEGRITKEGFDSSNTKYLSKDSVMIALNGQGKTRGTVAILRVEATCNQSLVSILPNNKDILLTDYLFVCLSGMYQLIRDLTGDNQRSGLNMPIIRGIKIPHAPVSIQKEIVLKIEEERKVIEGNKKLIEIYTQKIQNRINKVWGEE